jgi:hypothetical protein
MLEFYDRNNITPPDLDKLILLFHKSRKLLDEYLQTESSDDI